jgi:signal recognition particle subunit SEC65
MTTQTDYVKRVQARLSRQGFSFTKDQIRGVFNEFVKDVENPTEEELANVANKLKYQSQFASKAKEETQDSNNGDMVVASASEVPEIIEITPEDNPDIWETLQPPAEEPQPTPDSNPQPESLALAQEVNDKNGIVKTDNATNGLIPQDEVKDLVSKTFADQPESFQEQISEYALTHSFENVRQVQTFLEQLRGMEFNLLFKTLQDHINRRGSMLNVLNEVLTGEKAKDEAKRTDFFITSNNRLASFEKEMEAKLSKQGI